MQKCPTQKTLLDELVDSLEKDVKITQDLESFNAVRDVVNALLSSISHYYPPFSFSAIDETSFFVVKGTSRFKAVISFKYLKSVHVEESSVPIGLALVRLPETSPVLSAWRSVCVRTRFGKEYISPSFLRSSISKLLTKLVCDGKGIRSFLKIKERIQMTNTSTSDILSLEIQIGNARYGVELLPAIECVGLWPTCAHQWKVRNCSLDSEKKKAVLESGVHLVAKPTRAGFHWKIWFCSAEKSLLQFDQFPCKLKCLRLLEKVLFSHLGCTFLTSYHIYTLLLHESVEFSEKEHWVQNKLRLRLKRILIRLYQCLTTSYCQHVFIPSLNLFRGISSSDLEEFSRRLQPLIPVNVLKSEQQLPLDIARASSAGHFKDEIRVETTWL